MISTIQKKRATEKLLIKWYEKGIQPTLTQISKQVQEKFLGKRTGEPLMSPQFVTSNQVVDPKVLTYNVTAAKDDLETLFEDCTQALELEPVLHEGYKSEVGALKQRLITLQEEVKGYLLREGSQGYQLIFDDFRNSDKINLYKSTVEVNNSGGFVTLPISYKDSVRYYPSNIKLEKETKTSGVTYSSGTFPWVFNDLSDKVWEAIIPQGEQYQVTINVTGKEVVAGHNNEVELSRVKIEPLTPLTLEVESSVDSLNWNKHGVHQINGTSIIDIDPVWCLYIRFTVRGNGTVGIRKIELNKVGTVSIAELYSKVIASDETIYNLMFSVEEDEPYGTEISHFFGIGSNGPWTRITPGLVTINESIKFVEFFNSCTYESTTGLYRYDLVNGTPVPESGLLQRGAGQFKVEAFSFNWESAGDKNHIPDIRDWDGSFGDMRKCYMGIHSQLSGTSIAPATISASGSSFMVNYTNTEQVWWGLPIQNTAGQILTPFTNYRVTTHLYSDRSILLESGGGGVYTLTAALAGLKGFGWALYINGKRTAADNTVYHVNSIPGSGTLSSTQGKTFPVQIVPGWNKIEVLLYIPSSTTLGAVAGTDCIFLLRPDIVNFTLRTRDQWVYVPTQNEYPIWGDGTYMTQVSEFMVRYNTTPWNDTRWGWRITAPSGTPTGVILNFNPAPTSGTVDGKYKGNDIRFELKYLQDYIKVNELYYKAELKKQSGASVPPRLKSYRFITTNKVTEGSQ